eukprot:SAG31_NODE_6384_length_2037_cov_3.816305_1_plen_368_part_10
MELNVTTFSRVPSAADAVLALHGAGAGPTKVVTRPASLSVAFAADPAEPARLYSRTGGDGSANDFYPRPPVEIGTAGFEQVLQNQCGTGSFVTLPFFQVEWSRRRAGILFSLGWSGQWLAAVRRNASTITATAGLGGSWCDGAPDGSGEFFRDLTLCVDIGHNHYFSATGGRVKQHGANDVYPAFSVVPGETLRLLRALTIGYKSETDSALHQSGLNLHRRLILDSIAPRAYQTPGRWPWATSEEGVEARPTLRLKTASEPPIYPLISAIANPSNKSWCPGNESQNMKLLEMIRSVPGIEEIWVDIGWNSGGTLLQTVRRLIFDIICAAVVFVILNSVLHPARAIRWKKEVVVKEKEGRKGARPEIPS